MTGPTFELYRLTDSDPNPPARSAHLGITESFAAFLMMMYDRATKSLWRQFTGEPVVGAQMASGIKLEILPVLLTTWGDWLSTHPDTTVLDIDAELYPAAAYVLEGPQSIYYRVRQQPETSFSVWDKSGRLPEKSEVLGLIVGGEARAYPAEVLR